MKPRDRCCCAIPTVNVGVYTVLVEQFALGIIAGTLSIATTHIVGAASPRWSKWIFAIICYIAAALQVLGFLGVAKERPITFRRYLTLHIMATLAAFSVSAVWIIISAAKHNTAKSDCENTYFSTSNSTSTDEGDTMCEIFPWVDVGLMAGLWVLLAISQFYFYVVISGYSYGQQEDHLKYDSLYSVNNQSDIPMTKRDPWDARDEPPYAGDVPGPSGGYSHVRNVSNASEDAMLNDSAYPRQPFPDYPNNAYTNQSQPTPHYPDPYYNDNGYPAEMNVSRPEHIQAHPGQS